ncbi:zinc metalloproteinase nas-4-like [Stylophora pistillata]|uniref:zinc metalloproteinase nas-4-like n=1 Tax=Stylophora pistillata TaxID=50429 RepID=UPI000C05029C|nr:zinc metalloproteinase nas-4-like [Stylophora pistillata]
MNSLRREIVFTGLVLVLTLVHPSLITLGQKMKGIKLADHLEGDIKLSPNVQSLVAKGVKTDKNYEPNERGAVTNKIYLWTNGIVPYVIDSAFDSYSSDRRAIKDAIATVEQISCVRFKTRTNEQYYIKFVRGYGCWSYVGQVHMSGSQPISIGTGCGFIGTVLHELMHALGFFHTSSRHDRDSYVVVMSKNIMKGYEVNFKKYNHGDIDRLEAPYDMTSLMHLPKDAFSRNGLNTLEARAGPNVPLGRTDKLSEIDKAQLNSLYSCTGYPSCYKAFGMESFKIPDSKITASSYKMYHEPHQARLHMVASASGNGAWCASQSFQQGEWLQVDLGGRKVITGIATQGKVNLFVNAWTTFLELWYSMDQNIWYKGFSGQLISANFDMSSVQYNQAPTPFTARYVRFEPMFWYNEICLRVEIYGCDA